MNELAIIEKTIIQKSEQFGNVRNADGTWAIGNPGNPDSPGRPKDTPETKIIKKASKQLIAEFKERLSEALPLITPVLIAKALEGDLGAIKELADRSMGKPAQAVDVTSGGERLSVLSKEEKDKIESLFNANQQGFTQISN
jgi:hypothetical protein